MQNTLNQAMDSRFLPAFAGMTGNDGQRTGNDGQRKSNVSR